MTYKQAFEDLSERMDKREAAIKTAIELKNKHGYLPDKYKYLELFFNEKPWRKDKRVFNKIKKAAKLRAKNSNYA